MENLQLDRNTDTVIIVPVYNEGEVLGEVIADVFKHFVNVICVDDGSSDNSAEIARRSGAKVIAHPMNLGQGAALQTGFDAALLIPEAKYFVTFDADGQHSVSDAQIMVKRLRQGDVQIVFGSRFLDNRTNVSFSKRLVLKLAVTYSNALTGLKLTDAHNGLRAFNREVIETIEIKHDGMAHASEIVNQVSRGKFDYTEIPVHIVYTEYSKAKGQSLWNSVNILFDLTFRSFR